MAQNEKFIRDESICVLCGKEPASTGKGDHIPPISVYTKAEKKSATYQFHTVPACIQCNTAGSKHDEAFKIMMGIASGEFRQNPDDVIGVMARTIDHNNRLANQLFSTISRTPEYVSVEFDRKSYEEAISRMTRGIYWTMTNTILDPLAKMTVTPVSEIARETLVILEECARDFPNTEINGGTLKCKLITADNADMMLLQFFDKHAVLVLIN